MTGIGAPAFQTVGVFDGTAARRGKSHRRFRAGTSLTRHGESHAEVRVQIRSAR
jgi:hypothetical protein